MAVIETNPARIEGPWTTGFVLDKHIIRSVPIGYLGQHMQFETTRTPLGELVYQFKNRNGPPDEITETAVDFVIKTWGRTIEGVIYPPPSIRRARQPAAALAVGIAAALNVQVLEDVVTKVEETLQMKNVAVDRRANLLRKAIQVGRTPVTGMRLLIVDDLWQTGETMRRVAEVALEAGAAELLALAMTRTR